MKTLRKFPAFTLFLLVTLGAGTTDNGTFRFLTQSLPDGTTNAQYAARFITANADGPITFTNLSSLPAGLSLDPQSGYLTGRPTATFNSTITIAANDGTQQIQIGVSLKINAAGGGGNGGATFVNTSLPIGRIGSAYSDQLTITNGVGPFTYGAEDLPPGISLDGTTGALYGNPTTAGRYFVTFSAYDAGEANNSATVLPILVLPGDSDFQFITQSLNNGEVGTPFYDAYAVTNAAGPVSFAATGLPPGLTLDPTNGVVSGTPTVPGTFEVWISASDGLDTITCNLGMIIVPSATSHFYWNVFSLPPGLLGVAYDRQPPITVAAVNGVNVSYSATGLPPGIQYNPLTGALTGTPTEVGEYDTLFVATDSATSEVLTLPFHFVILPATGGDISNVPLNLWLTKQKLLLGLDGAEAWSGQLLFNTDRRTGARFDPATESLSLTLGSRTLMYPAGSLVGTDASMKSNTPSGQLPSESLRLSLSKQTIQWKSTHDSIDGGVPGLYDFALNLGGQSYRTAVKFDAKGNAKALSAARPCFVLAKGRLKAGYPGLDRATLSMFLSDANFGYTNGDTLRIRLLQGTTVLLDRDFTALGLGRQTTNKLGQVIFNVRSVPDSVVANRIARFSFNSARGSLSLGLTGLTLSALTNGEAQVITELTIRNKVYWTGVTYFGVNPGNYSTSMP